MQDTAPQAVLMHDPNGVLMSDPISGSTVALKIWRNPTVAFIFCVRKPTLPISILGHKPSGITIGMRRPLALLVGGPEGVWVLPSSPKPVHNTKPLATVITVRKPTNISILGHKPSGITIGMRRPLALVLTMRSAVRS